MSKIIYHYYIICDKCGARMTAEDSEWITTGENHYCQDCYDFIEINDIPKPDNRIKKRTE